MWLKEGLKEGEFLLFGEIVVILHSAYCVKSIYVRLMNTLKRTLHNIITWYASRQAMPYWSILFLDCIFVLVSGFFSYALINGALNALHASTVLLPTLLLYLVCYLIGFKLFHTYSGILRFSSFIDLQKVALAVLVGLLLTMAVQFCLPERPDEWPLYLSPAVLVLAALFSIILMWGARIWGKMLYDGYTRQSRTIRTFIYGTKDGGVSIAKHLNAQPNSPYLLSGFVSDNPLLYGMRLMGVKIYPNDDDLIHTLSVSHVHTLIVAPCKVNELRKSEEMVNNLVDAGVKLLFFPEAQEWDGKSELNYGQLREIDAEDLLPRDRIEIDMEAVGNLLRGKRILITGAAGSIGSEMVRQIAGFDPEELILIDQAETPLHDIRLMMAGQWPMVKSHTIVADISHRGRMEEIFAKFRPEYVFHAAAYKHVPMMEDNPGESVSNNIEGTRVVADLAVKYGTLKFVMVSTDKAVNPTNVMGCSKRICEIYVQSLDKAIKEGKVKGNTQFVTTRFGNVLGSNGSVIPLFRQQIKNGGPVTVTHPDIIRFFMLIPEACRLVLEAGTMGHGGEIYVFDMGKPVRIADLAKRMIRLSGAKDIEIKFTGLRDGEKLYEEVLNDAELTKPTIHPKIMIATVREYDYAEVQADIEALVNLGCADSMEIVAKMKAIVPEYKSQHSIYEKLDNKKACQVSC